MREIKKKRKFQKKVGATNKKSPEDNDQDILGATVAWVIEENLPINATVKNSFRRILYQIDSHCPTFDSRTTCSEIENLGEVCREAAKRELKGRYISITTDHWNSKKTENYSVLTSHWLEGGKFKSYVLNFEHCRGRNRGEDIGR